MVNSVIDSNTSTGTDAYEVSITYKNTSGKSLTINPYNWSTVLHTGSDEAHVGGDCSFHLDNISDGEEWIGVVILWKKDNTEKIKFESSTLNFLQDDEKSATWIIASDTKTDDNTNSENGELSENATDAMSETTGNVLLDAEFKTKAVMNAVSTEQSGKYGCIEITKEELKSVTMEQYDVFYNKCVSGSGYNWVSIICEYGTEPWC